MTFFNPTIGRRCRMFTSLAQVDDYHRGWLNAFVIRHDACGSPAQQGALDRAL